MFCWINWIQDLIILRDVALNELSDLWMDQLCEMTSFKCKCTNFCVSGVNFFRASMFKLSCTWAFFNCFIFNFQTPVKEPDRENVDISTTGGGTGLKKCCSWAIPVEIYFCILSEMSFPIKTKFSLTLVLASCLLQKHDFENLYRIMSVTHCLILNVCAQLTTFGCIIVKFIFKITMVSTHQIV